MTSIKTLILRVNNNIAHSVLLEVINILAIRDKCAITTRFKRQKYAPYYPTYFGWVGMRGREREVECDPRMSAASARTQHLYRICGGIHNTFVQRNN